MPVESAPAGAGWLCTQPHVACLALQASPERGGSKEQRVTYERAGLASAQSTSGAHTVRTMRTTVYRSPLLYRGADGLARLAVSVAFEFLLAAEQDAEHVRHPVVPHVLSLEVLVAKDAIQCVEQLGVVGR